MRLRLILAVAVTFLLAACGGSEDGSLPPPIPNGNVRGVAHDNVLIGSTITAYRYGTNEVLATAVTNSVGNYGLTVQSETTPLLIEATGGYYKEEASGKQVTLKSDQRLTAVFNYRTASEFTVAVTPYTHVAAGLAAYRIKQGISVAAAIDSANKDVSEMLGFDIITTKPVDITNSDYATAYFSNAYAYGFLSAAISSWTMFASAQNGQDGSKLHTFFTSVAFGQVMYADVVADGVLDGWGVDETGQRIPLSFGIVSLSTHVYRHGFAAHLIAMVNRTDVNKIGLKESDLLTYAGQYASGQGALYGHAEPLPFVNGGRPAINLPASFAASGWLSGTITLSDIVTSTGSVLSAAVSVDGTPVGIPTTGANPTFILDTRLYSEGQHNLNFTVLDSYGVSASQTLSVGFDNTVPLLPTINNWSQAAVGTNLTLTRCGTSSDLPSGVASVSVAFYYFDLYTDTITLPSVPNTVGNWCASATLNNFYNIWTNQFPENNYYMFIYSFRVMDKAGNCSCYSLFRDDSYYIFPTFAPLPVTGANYLKCCKETSFIEKVPVPVW